MVHIQANMAVCSSYTNNEDEDEQEFDIKDMDKFYSEESYCMLLIKQSLMFSVPPHSVL